MKYQHVIAWFSGGITSAVACKIAIDMFGKEHVKVFNIGTRNEEDDTSRFMADCEKWYGVPIETAYNAEYKCIQDVWYRFLSLNVATGAICSTELKRKVREHIERIEPYDLQVFGFDIDEAKRAKNMAKNYPKSKPFFPLLAFGLSKKDCLKMLPNDLFLRIEPPYAYKLGFNNNNCLQTGCVQGGIGYWQKMQREFPDKFDAMAKVEHDLTDKKGEPVTMLKDQSKDGGLVFLKPHPNYPHIKDISMMEGRAPKPLLDCNGFCGTNDLLRNETENELNYDTIPA